MDHVIIINDSSNSMNSGSLKYDLLEEFCFTSWNAVVKQDNHNNPTQILTRYMDGDRVALYQWESYGALFSKELTCQVRLAGSDVMVVVVGSWDSSWFSYANCKDFHSLPNALKHCWLCVIQRDKRVQRENSYVHNDKVNSTRGIYDANLSLIVDDL